VAAIDERNAAHHTWKVVYTYALQALLLAGGAFLVWLWLHDGGISGVKSSATLFTSAGRITGLLGGYLLAVQVLLLVRLPFLEWIAGFDRLTRWHRLNGKVTLYLILAHVGLITIGYALLARQSVLGESSTLLSSYYGIVAALVGTILLVVVVLTSITIVRRRLRFETWYVVHLLTYAGITLSWFHETRTGLDFVTNPWAAAFWAGLYIVTLELVLIFRVLQPALRYWFHRFTVESVTYEGAQTTSVRITGRHLAWLNAKPGQFFLWRFLTPGRRWEAHPFSLSEAPNGKSLRITCKAVGDFTVNVGEIKPGTRVVAEGPFGSLTDMARTRDKVLLIAGGIGITPLRALAETMTGNVVLVYRAISDADIIFRDELEALAEKRGITIHYVLGDHRAPKNKKLMSPEHLRRLIPDVATREIFLSGPPLMVAALDHNVRHLGVPRRFIHVEQFAL
jgi:predicted ferric reductase